MRYRTPLKAYNGKPHGSGCTLVTLLFPLSHSDSKDEARKLLFSCSLHTEAAS